MKISEVTEAVVSQFLRLPDEAEGLTVSVMLAAAKQYVLSYTGLTAEHADELHDLTIALLVLCADMYDNRSMTVDNNQVNTTVRSILDMRSVNLI